MDKIVLGIEALHVNMKKITGIERYVFLVLEALNSYCFAYKKIKKIIIFTTNEFDVYLYDNLNIEFRVSDIDTFTENVNLIKPDLLHCTFIPPELNISVPVVYTLHDVGRYLYPEYMDQALMREHIYKLDQLLKANKCTILTVSEASKLQIKNVLQINDDINFCAPLYPNENFCIRVSHMEEDLPYLSKLKLSNFILVVGCFIPTKNVISIINAYKKCLNDKKIPGNTELVIVGKVGWDVEVEEISQKTNGIRRLTDVSDDELLQLYKGCNLFVSASLIEGFGLPLIEAAYLKAPIICSKIPPYCEILPSLGHFFSPLSIDEIADGMYNFFGKNTDYTKDISKFSAENMGRLLLKCYEDSLSVLKK